MKNILCQKSINETKEDKYKFDLSIVTIAYNVNNDLEDVYFQFSKILVEHIIVILKNKK